MEAAGKRIQVYERAGLEQLELGIPAHARAVISGAVDAKAGEHCAHADKIVDVDAQIGADSRQATGNGHADMGRIVRVRHSSRQRDARC